MDTLAITLDATIAERIRWRRWYRDRRRVSAGWADLERENTLLLRELLRVRRVARSLERPVLTPEKSAAISRIVEAFDVERGEYPDPDEMGYHDFQVEGLPEFNGSWRR